MEYKKTLMWKEISEAGEALENFLSVNTDTINGLTAAVEKKGVKIYALREEALPTMRLFILST